MSGTNYNKEVDFLRGMREKGELRSGVDALDLSLNRESVLFSISNEIISLKVNVILDEGEMDISDFLSKINHFSDESKVDCIISNFYPLEGELFQIEGTKKTILSSFSITDADCQFSIYLHQGLVRFTIDANAEINYTDQNIGVDLSQIKFACTSRLGVRLDNKGVIFIKGVD